MREAAVNERPAILSVAGGYWTGASAVVDLLAGHQDAVVLDGEFTLFSFGQYFAEVTTPLLNGERLSSAALRTIWRYREFNRPERHSLLRRIARRGLSTMRLHPPSLSVARTAMAERLGERYARACAVLDAMVTAGSRPDVDLRTHLGPLVDDVLCSAVAGASLRATSRRSVGVFDQLVAPPYESDARAVLPGLRCIVVDRDWRDQYISMRPAFARMDAVNRNLGVRPWDESREDVGSSFRSEFLRLRARIDAERLRADASRTLWLTFEEVVVHPAESSRRIFEFVGLDPSRWNPVGRFAPDRSRRRIGKWRSAALRGTPIVAEIEALLPILGTPTEVTA